MTSRHPPPPPHRTTTASGMRRNLFSSQLSRRPPPITATGGSIAVPTGPSSTSATSATTLQLDPTGNGNNGGSANRNNGGGNGSHHADDEEGEDRDVVARDAEGNYRLEMPSVVGSMLRDEVREEREVESRLLETYRKHHPHIEPNEFRATLQASLLAKVESLDEDKWMFEGEDPLSS